MGIEKETLVGGWSIRKSPDASSESLVVLRSHKIKPSSRTSRGSPSRFRHSQNAQHHGHKDYSYYMNLLKLHARGSTRGSWTEVHGRSGGSMRDLPPMKPAGAEKKEQEDLEVGNFFSPICIAN